MDRSSKDAFNKAAGGQPSAGKEAAKAPPGPSPASSKPAFNQAARGAPDKTQDQPKPALKPDHAKGPRGPAPGGPMPGGGPTPFQRHMDKAQPAAAQRKTGPSGPDETLTAKFNRKAK